MKAVKLEKTLCATAPDSLEKVLQHPGIWRAIDYKAAIACSAQTKAPIATGFASLDALLPEKGWPQDEVIELLAPRWGCGELPLITPALKHLSQQERWIVWVNPPWLPYAPGLANAGIDISRVIIVTTQSPQEALWAAEESLQSGCCSAVLGWPENPLPQHIKRLQLAAQKGGSLCVLNRGLKHAQQPSPAPLRIELGSSAHALQLRILKCRGSWGSNWITLDHSQDNRTPLSLAAYSTLPETHSTFGTSNSEKPTFPATAQTNRQGLTTAAHSLKPAQH